jgi:hypothetical protein
VRLSETLEQLVLDHAREAVSIPELVEEVLGAVKAGGNIGRGVERILQKRLTAEQGRIGSQTLSRAMTKQIDGLMEHEMKGVTIQQRQDLIRPMAEAAALHLMEAAAALAAYPDKAAAVVAAKEARDAGAVVVARRERLEVDQRLDKALLNAHRALSGADQS